MSTTESRQTHTDEEPQGGHPAAWYATEGHPAAWYDNPEGPGLRYWDGSSWTDNYHPGRADSISRREALWALALGFGATGGVVGFLSIPVIAFYFPLGFGTAGAALAIVAATQKGPTPWYAAVAVIATLAALGLGIDAYGQFNDAQEGLNHLNNLLR